MRESRGPSNTDQAMDLAGLDGQINLAQRMHAAEHL